MKIPEELRVFQQKLQRAIEGASDEARKELEDALGNALIALYAQVRMSYQQGWSDAVDDMKSHLQEMKQS